MINISMPVILFSDSSVLGRMAECFVFSPNYFEKVNLFFFLINIIIIKKKAGTISNPLEQFKLVVTFNIAILHFGIE